MAMALNSSTEPVPQLKAFVFNKRLGSGTYATVYRVHHKNNVDDVYAVKCIKKSSLNKNSTENILREIEILKNIKHEYIVHLKDFQWDENYIYLIMEYCPGGDLSGFIKSRRTIPEKYVRRFVQQIACALKHLHSKGIAHMDLKPQNILLTSANNPSLKLADFGFAQSMRENKLSSSLRGSPLYMAPEILKCKVYDSKVDLWSVGVILHEVIFGYAPFTSSSLEELETKILAETPVEIPSNIMISETCRDLLKRLLQRNPYERITFEQFFNHPFVDLEHMPSANCLPKSNELMMKAKRADERRELKVAQRYYLQSIEYLIPAIQYEKENAKKEELRAKAKALIRRAEELASLAKSNNNKQSAEQATARGGSASSQNSHAMALSGANMRTMSADLSNMRITKNLPVIDLTDEHKKKESFLRSTTPTTMSNASLTAVSSIDSDRTSPLNMFKFVKIFENNSEVDRAIKMCLDADEKMRDPSKYEEAFNRFQLAISSLLPFAKSLSKESDESKLLKTFIEKRLSKAEFLITKINEQKELKKLKEANDECKEDDDDNSYYNQCCVQ